MHFSKRLHAAHECLYACKNTIFFFLKKGTVLAPVWAAKLGVEYEVRQVQRECLIAVLGYGKIQVKYECCETMLKSE